jgi:FixJ family two-component response regulator
MPPASAPSPATVFIVDDDVSYLRSISRLLRASGFHIVAHASAAEFLEGLHADLKGCVVTDLMMPGMDGMALQESMRKAGNLLPVIFLSGHGDIPTTVEAMRGGAEDFLTKRAPKEDIIAAVRRALAHNEQQRAEEARLQALRRPFEFLTDREREVLLHVVQGKLNKQIAAELGIHERTVKLHRTHLTTKLQVHSVAELTRLVQEAGVFQAGTGDPQSVISDR